MQTFFTSSLESIAAMETTSSSCFTLKPDQSDFGLKPDLVNTMVKPWVQQWADFCGKD